MNNNNLFRWLILGGAIFAAWKLWQKAKEQNANGPQPTGSIGTEVDAPVSNIGAPLLVAGAGTSPFAAGGLNVSNQTNIGVAR